MRRDGARRDCEPRLLPHPVLHLRRAPQTDQRIGRVVDRMRPAPAPAPAPPPGCSAAGGRQRCAGTGTASIPCRRIGAPARAIHRAAGRARSSRSPCLSASTSRRRCRDRPAPRGPAPRPRDRQHWSQMSCPRLRPQNRRAAAVADGATEKRRVLPAPAAERARILDMRAAGDALRRVEHPSTLCIRPCSPYLKAMSAPPLLTDRAARFRATAGRANERR
jgi:hypothetical protein